jgi:hypothetical protein
MTERTITSDVVTCPVCCKADQFTDAYEHRKLMAMLEYKFDCRHCGAAMVSEAVMVFKSTEIKDEQKCTQ